MTKQEMWLIVRAHMDAEFRQDVAGTLTTMTSEPFYELHPLGLRVEGAGAITQMYLRMWPGIYPYVVANQSLTMGTQPAQSCIWHDENSIAIREWAEVLTPNGIRRSISEMALFHFEGALLKGETLYCDGPLSDLMREVLGSDFTTLQGVKKLY